MSTDLWKHLVYKIIPSDKTRTIERIKVYTLGWIESNRNQKTQTISFMILCQEYIVETKHNKLLLNAIFLVKIWYKTCKNKHFRTRRVKITLTGTKQNISCFLATSSSYRYLLANHRPSFQFARTFNFNFSKALFW